MHDQILYSVLSHKQLNVAVWDIPKRNGLVIIDVFVPFSSNASMQMVYIIRRLDIELKVTEPSEPIVKIISSNEFL